MRTLALCFLACLILFACKEQEEKMISKLDEKTYPYDQFYINQNFPHTSVDTRDIARARQAVKDDMLHSKRATGQWEEQGPGNIGARINTIAAHPTNSNEMMLGFASGGVFKTTDNGENWAPMFDEQVDLNIGDITYDPNDGNTVYVGTGDPNISGFPKLGSGIFKSEDGGQTWAYKGLREANIISKVHVAPTDSDIIYVSSMGIPFKKTTDRGVYKSTDGGDNWKQILQVNDSTGVIDMAVHPSDPNIIYAAGWNRLRSDQKSRIVGPDARIHKSIDGGQTWTMLEGGLPVEESLGRIGLAMSGTNPDHVYAMYINTGGAEHCSHGGSQLMGIWDSTDGGATWNEINTGENSGLPCNALGGFAWYFGKLRVNPNDDNHIFLLGVDMYVTRDKGESWSPAVPNWSTYQVHADKHDLVFVDDKAILATDGGAYRANIDSLDWVDIENIAATQFYRTGYNPHKPDTYYGGAQDNGTSSGNGMDINSWQRIYGGDGFEVGFDNEDSLIMYASSQRGNLVVSFTGGQWFESGNTGFDSEESSNWDSPYILSPHNNKILYYGRESMYRGFNDGEFLGWEKISPRLINHGPEVDNDFFQRTISEVSQSPINADYLYAGTSDARVWHSPDAGASWNNISEGVPYRYISDVYASPTYEATVYVSVTGYKSDDSTAYIYRSDDQGNSWTPISDDLPPIPVNEIFVLPEHDDRVIFAATNGGVYVTQDAGENWDRLGNNMPIIEVYDLDYNVKNHSLIAGTFARGIQTFDLTQIGIDMPSSSQEISDINLEIYPSTTNGKFQIKTDEKILDIKAFDLSGNMVLAILDKNQPDISALPNGMYIISIQTANGSKSKKIIKHGLE